jgi:hypothetical protein
MNLFRSEEHARNWSGYRAEAEGGLTPLRDMLYIFSSENFTERLGGHYITKMADFRRDLMARIKAIKGDDPFWSVPG